MSNFQKRLLSALVLGLSVAIMLFQGPVVFMALMALLYLISIKEWLILNSGGLDPNQFYMNSLDTQMAAAGIQGQNIDLGGQEEEVDIADVSQSSFAPIPDSNTIEEENQPRRGNIVLFFFGALYITFGIISLSYVRLSDMLGHHHLIFLVTIVWATDSFAYFVGKMFGGKLLAPSISPKKTWSGAIGGASIAILFGFIAATQVYEIMSLSQVIIVSLLVSIASQFGDLLESATKRYYGVKDIGKTIPGHGGLLDRIDGLLLAAPFMVFLHYLGLV
ncbi:MAG: phosphatidate cytidylyltransferase [Alphaproteobacteria bacterium]